MRTEKSFCRLCFGFCGMDVDIDRNDRVVAVRGDRDNPLTKGYACVKGLDAPAALYGASRIMHPLKRVDGRQVRVGLEQALDEIAERMRVILAEQGGQSLGFFTGTGMMGSNAAIFSLPGLCAAVDGQRYSTMTIDQSAKWVTSERLGTWDAGRQSFDGADVWLFAGANPLVSVFSWYTPAQNPMKAIKEARARGTKLIVIDPRRCELAQFADLHLQINPGEDAAVAAGLIHIVLAGDWQDHAFCDEHVAGLDRLRNAVAEFTPAMVAARAGIDAALLVEAADIFARQSRRGGVCTGTGVDMARFPNLSEHLYETLGVICGRFPRAGEDLPNGGVLIDRPVARAEVRAPQRGFERGPRSRVRGAVRLMGESASATLPEDILEPGPGRVRGLFVAGANPLGSMPDDGKVLEAFRALDLLVAIEPFRTATAHIADYVLPPKILYEHADFTFGLELTNLAVPYCQYTPALVPPPAGSELCDEGYVAWALAKRLGVALSVMGTDMDMATPPTEEDFHRLLTRESALSYDELVEQAHGGRMFDLPAKPIGPAGDTTGRFAVMPEDVAAEVAAFLATRAMSAEIAASPEFGFRLIVRRMREVSNTSYRDFRSAKARTPYNPLAVHPDDLADLGLRDGGWAEVSSANGSIRAIVKADATLKRRIVSMTHGFGGLPGEPADYLRHGVSLSPLISLSRDCEPLQAMPRMSGIAVRITPEPARSAATTIADLVSSGSVRTDHAGAETSDVIAKAARA